jgi:hypothetical protein
MRFLRRQGRDQDLGATYESRGNSDAAPRRSSGYGDLAEQVIAFSQNGFEREETRQAKDEIVYLPDGNGRADVLADGKFRGSKGHNCCTEVRIG